MISHQTLTLVGTFHLLFAYSVTVFVQAVFFKNTFFFKRCFIETVPAEHDREELQDRVDRLRNGAEQLS